MSGSGENAAPVIIKRKKVTGGDGHHGGAWKVAYADFVTAMMAFFLLMWLLNATTEKQRKGIADYFSPTVPISRVSGGGDGDFGGESVFSEVVLPQNGTGATQMRPTESSQARGEMGLNEDGASSDTIDESQQDVLVQAKENIEDILAGKSGESTVSKDTRRHIVTRVTDEGLIIEIFDRDNAPLFEGNTDQETQLLQEIVALVAAASRLVENDVAIEGHVRAAPVVKKENPVWDISIARADRVRELLEDANLTTERISRVTGHADREPTTSNKMSVRNNRLEVILLRDGSP
ncbi:flagellar motor protein MotB [Roseovarius rhodophyticola]|uniref:Flagellar motor protein MotB n=1 Tax=Roseovarius rhodophyticola TaxID=3080827 RepID=A0ABZ2TJ11_9RHOB|nr:flagellar motor protein MotB [Roseovarius sp. W115]MDV2930010.1 flagellar motor protein MotB [Roseovarius sp. W115]